MMKILSMSLVIALTAAISSFVWGQEGAESSQELSKHDQLRIAVQDICPVTGEKLGSMGSPVKTTVGDAKEEIFLCCAGCAKGKIDPQHWATIHANIAQAQGKCPISKKELPANDAKFTVANGEAIYACCPSCIKKIDSNPEAAQAQVDKYYAAYLQSQDRK